MLTNTLRIASLGGRGETPGPIAQADAAEASGLKSDVPCGARRCQSRFRQRFAVTARLPACATCDTDHSATGCCSEHDSTVPEPQRWTR